MRCGPAWAAVPSTRTPRAGWCTRIGAGNNADGRIEVFGTGRLGVHHRWQSGFATWSDQWTWLNDAGPAIN